MLQRVGSEVGRQALHAICAQKYTQRSNIWPKITLGQARLCLPYFKKESVFKRLICTPLCVWGKWNERLKSALSSTSGVKIKQLVLFNILLDVNKNSGVVNYVLTRQNRVAANYTFCHSVPSFLHQESVVSYRPRPIWYFTASALNSESKMSVICWKGQTGHWWSPSISNSNEAIEFI